VLATHLLGGWIDSITGQERVKVKVSISAIFWVVWKPKIMCFENAMPMDPCDIVYMNCQLIDY
jgi:hypothetical protein